MDFFASILEGFGLIPKCTKGKMGEKKPKLPLCIASFFTTFSRQLISVEGKRLMPNQDLLNIILEVQGIQKEW